MLELQLEVLGLSSNRLNGSLPQVWDQLAQVSLGMVSLHAQAMPGPYVPVMWDVSALVWACMLDTQLHMQLQVAKGDLVGGI